MAASPAKAVNGKAVLSLGTFGAVAAPGGAETTWSASPGSAGCFSYYKISWSQLTHKPSYLGANDGRSPRVTS